MAGAALGGGSGAVGASSHANCARFRGTDPLVTNRSRRKLAADLNFPDSGGGIPEARWMRAMTLERLVRDERFASKVATRTVGDLRLERPTEVVVANAKEKTKRTEKLLVEAHDRAVADGAATVVHQLAVPFVGFEGAGTTDVKPDFAVVARKAPGEGAGSWLVVGDVKDYERIRSRIDDARLLKGFLQVAVGAESFAAWSRTPSGMDVHPFGVLAVPQNAFLQPAPVVEDLADYRSEVAMRIAERVAEAEQFAFDGSTPVDEFVAHLVATFDPAACTTCTLFGYCRDELERSADPTDLLVEIGVPVEVRPLVRGMVDGTGEIGNALASVRASVKATVTGAGEPTGQKRIDPVGQPGTVNVVIAKSDAAALGVHGIAVQRVSSAGASEWAYRTFDAPQSSATRREVMKVLGTQIADAMSESLRAHKDSPAPVHVVVPDRVTADVLASIADNLAGVELSRLRWERDREQRRPALTYDGDKADIPRKLAEVPRTAVSFFLEEDRARAISLRSPVVNVRDVLARHVVAGGPAASSSRLDYLVEWADASGRVDHRAFGKSIEASPHTPGARLTNSTSDEIHRALAGGDRRSPAPDPARYAALVRSELEYKTAVFDRAVAALDALPVSNLRDAYRTIESEAQDVWRRRLDLHASDLVRFGRTSPRWRNFQVPTIDANRTCSAQLQSLANPQAAEDMAAAAGNREVAFATVVSVDPDVVLAVESRRIGPGHRVVLLHVNGSPCVDAPGVDVDLSPKGAFKIDGLSIGPLADSGAPASTGFARSLVWRPKAAPSLAVGDRVIVGDFAWYSGKLKGNRYLKVEKLDPDQESAPKKDCTQTSYDDDPTGHRWCCRSHEHAEADWSDELAGRRSRGEMNPDVWPPVRDADAFEVAGKGTPEGDPFAVPSEAPPAGLTIDDLE